MLDVCSWAVLDGMGNAIGGKIAKGDFRLVGRLAGEDGTQVAGGVASEKAPQGLGVMTVGMEIVEEARNGVGDFACGATIADGARNSGDLADAAADAEVVGVDHIGALFDFFPFDANVGDPMLTAGVGAAGDVDLDVFLVAGKRESSSSVSQRAKDLVSVRASLQNSEPVQATVPRTKEEVSTGRPLAARSRTTELTQDSGMLIKRRFCIGVVRTWASPWRSVRSAARRSCAGVTRPRTTLAPMENRPGCFCGTTPR